ncbi:DUF6702 family protein [Lentiprolixibacter aurantiacus]|uniref:Peptidase E n=1 Tax=Lentiprolixibacter aurantiacus TaxID=2993939 RepID=A0AAE3MKV5_9FLAO|nr:DUF6702 family protein [Lentiprolixibacter aurantiacus]MCX2719248.1 hypothetical protein [Lentiprolixibacter aurantiacus]
MMKRKLICLFLLTMPLLGFTAHKFYVSVTHVNYVEKDDAFQITTRIFIDDFEAVLLERYGVKTALATPGESSVADSYIEKYLRAKLQIKLDGELQKYKFLGKRYDNDVIICYLEITQVNRPGMKSLEVQNEILTEMFEEQQNLVHLKVQGKKKSFVLYKESNKGMLNL